jgi:hypothetical protein
MQKSQVVLHARDDNTCRALRLLLAEWCELRAIGDLKSLDLYCKEHGEPVALIFENARPSPLNAGQGESKDVMTEFLTGVRVRHPTIRRVLIPDPDDLGTTINGLHARTIDSLLHRPFTLASVLTALRLEKMQAPPLRAGEFATG